MVCADEIDAINFVGRKCRISKGGVHISATVLTSLHGNGKPPVPE
jgi:hypothetical protein